MMGMAGPSQDSAMPNQAASEREKNSFITD